MNCDTKPAIKYNNMNYSMPEDTDNAAEDTWLSNFSWERDGPDASSCHGATAGEDFSFGSFHECTPFSPTDERPIQDYEPGVCVSPSPTDVDPTSLLPKQNDEAKPIFLASLDSCSSLPGVLSSPHKEGASAKLTKDANPDRLLSLPKKVPRRHSLPGKLAEAKLLGHDYNLTKWDVVCGRGRGNFEHVGNRRLRILISVHLRQFASAKTRNEKSIVIDLVVRQVREAAGPVGGFVKRDENGAWFRMTKTSAREKVGHLIRDLAKLQESKTSSIS